MFARKSVAAAEAERAPSRSGTKKSLPRLGGRGGMPALDPGRGRDADAELGRGRRADEKKGWHSL